MTSPRDYSNLSESVKEEIDSMTQAEMARLWRFAPVGHPFFVGEVGDYFIERFDLLGGMTPEISKEIGHG